MTDRTEQHTIIGIYDSHSGVETTVRVLQQAGLHMKRLAIVGKDFQTREQALRFYTSGDRIKLWGGRGAILGSVCGMLFGCALSFFIPGIGSFVVMGPLIGFIVGALEGAALGGAAGVLSAAFTGVGLSKDSVVKYELASECGEFLVLARGTRESSENVEPEVLGDARATSEESYPRS